jgi:hypothetical protein
MVKPIIASQAAHTAIGSVGRKPPGKKPRPWNEMILVVPVLHFWRPEQRNLQDAHTNSSISRQ